MWGDPKTLEQRPGKETSQEDTIGWLRQGIEGAKRELDKAEEKRAREAIAAWKQRMMQGVVQDAKL